MNKQSDQWNVVQFQVTDWPKDGRIRKPQTILQVIEEVIRRQQKIGGGPIVVHCRYIDCTHSNSYCLPLSSDTVSRCGVYCSVSIALEQCKTEGVIDVFQVIKGVRMNKPGAVTTLVIIA